MAEIKGVEGEVCMGRMHKYIVRLKNLIQRCFLFNLFQEMVNNKSPTGPDHVGYFRVLNTAKLSPTAMEVKGTRDQESTRANVSVNDK